MSGAARKHKLDRLLDDLALADFRERHGHPAMGPLVVVIPAYDEAENIRGVLDRIPSMVAGQPTSALVVVDGSKHDGEDNDAQRTVKEVQATGHLVCVSPVNRGQGAALRIGYRIARDHGARWLATLDADGQYDAGDLDRAVQPLVDGEADFVQGSRRLGTAEQDDRVRMAGVYFFSGVISAVTGTAVTDSSNGLRAMSVEVPAAVPLTEDQYHASELIIGALRRGFRVVERPVHVAKRSSGRSKKAPNALYALQYARVIAKTTWRDRRLPR